MAQGTILGQSGGGSKINGIIEEYKVASGGNVSAGDFVKFVEDKYSIATELTGIVSDSTNLLMAQLSSDKVLVIHKYSGNLHGLVCTVDGTTITAGTDVQLNTYGTSGDKSVIVLDSNRVFIAYKRYSNSKYYLYGMVCTVDGTTITAGTDIQLSTIENAGDTISAVLLDNNRIFIAHSTTMSSNYYYYLYGVVCIIDGTTITAGTEVQLKSQTTSGFHISAVSLDSNKVFIAHSCNKYYYLYGMVCTVDGTTITAGTDIQLSADYYSGYRVSALLLDSNRVFLAHSSKENSTNNTYYLYGMVCTINETVITASTDIQLSTIENAGDTISAVLLDNNRIFIAHRGPNDSSNQQDYVYGLTCIIDNVSILVNSDIKINNSKPTGSTASAVLLNRNKILVTYKAGSIFYGILGFMNNIDKASKGQYVLGVAKTKGTAGQTIKVIVQNIEEVN